MSKPRPPYLHRVVNRHGTVCWYVWRRPGPKIRIRGDYGTREFMEAHRAALYGEQAPEQPARDAGSLSAVVEAYLRSPCWRRLSDATKRQRSNIFDRLLRVSGHVSARSVEASDIKRRRDELGHGAAKHFVQTMRGLYQWAKEQELVDVDPTEGVKVARPQTEGFHVWSEEDIARYEVRWPVGTRERLWLAILLYTGLRRGDAVSLARAHIRDAATISIQTGKTGAWVTLPILPELQAIIDASPTGETTLIATLTGKPMTKESFGNLFREACKAAGVPGAAHGLRKAGATRAAEAGATVHELNSLFGWEGSKMAAHYTRTADRKRLAAQAIEKLKRK